MTAELFRRVSDHGVIVGVRTALAVPEPPLSPEEHVDLSALGPARRATFVAGRAAMRAALEASGGPRASVRRDDRGAPVVPAGYVGSISHKEIVAVALAARADGTARVGVDVEIPRATTIDVSQRVLTAEELAFADRLGDGRPRHVLRAFSMKEAIYKAIDPFLRRYVGFREVAIAEGPLDAPRVATFTPRPGEPALVIEVACAEVASPEGELILSTARARPA